MTSFGYWADRVPHGQFLCCLCFEARPVKDAWTDEQGQRWDVCQLCHEEDQAALRRKTRDEAG